MTPYRYPGLTLAALATLGLLAAIHPAQAATNIVANGGFDTPDLGSGYYYNPTTISPWTFTGNSGVINPPSDFDSGRPTVVAPSTGQYAFIQANTGPNGTVYQTLNLTAGTTYNLSFLYAGRNGTPGQTYNDVPYGGAANDLVSLIGDTGQGTLFSQNFSTISNQGFTNFAGSFTTTDTQAGNYTLAFSNISAFTSPSDQTSFVDNVNVSAAPEPSQLAGLAFTGFGALGLILKTRKRKVSEVTA